MLVSALQKTRSMKDLIESAYEEFASIVEGSWNRRMKEIALRDLYDTLGDEAPALDNIIYERLGMSAEEALDMLDRGDTLV